MRTLTGLDQKLAALFGTTYDRIAINDMVVHQPSRQIFLSVERGRGADALPAIVKPRSSVGAGAIRVAVRLFEELATQLARPPSSTLTM